MTSRKSLTADQVAVRHGFRSPTLEGKIGEQLTKLEQPVIYEAFKIPWELQKSCTYTPDFLLSNGVIIEAKGRFVTSDRQKHKYLKEQWPDLDIRFVFSRSASKISKTSKTSYAKWCQTNGFLYADCPPSATMRQIGKIA